MTHNESSQNSLQENCLRHILRQTWVNNSKYGARIFLEVSLLCIAITIAVTTWISNPSPWEGILAGIGTGFFTASLFSFWQESSQKEFFKKLESDLVFSWKWGTKLHPDHNNLTSRKEMIGLLDKEFKLLTTTADNYLMGAESAALQSALKRGVVVKFLLHTPLLFLRDFVTNVEDGSNVGQHRKHSSEIILKHLECSIDSIKKLQEQFGDSLVRVQFFTYRHVVNMAIYDQRRIFGAFLLGKTKGPELPCIEIFQGVSSHTAFDIFDKEFEELWEDKRNLTLENVIEIYNKVFDGITANDLITKRPFGFEHAEKIRNMTLHISEVNLAVATDKACLFPRQ